MLLSCADKNANEADYMSLCVCLFQTPKRTLAHAQHLVEIEQMLALGDDLSNCVAELRLRDENWQQRCLGYHYTLTKCLVWICRQMSKRMSGLDLQANE